MKTLFNTKQLGATDLSNRQGKEQPMATPMQKPTGSGDASWPQKGQAWAREQNGTEYKCEKC